MRIRRVLTLLIAPVLMLAVLVPLAGPAAAAQAKARVCVVAGTVNVEPGVGRIPPGANNDGGYTFNQVIIICAGVTADSGGAVGPEMTGQGSVTSTGAFGVGNCQGTDVELIGSFCGTYSASGFLVGPGCSGTVGGDEAANLNPANVLANDWSVTFGPVITGGVTCDTMGVSGTLVNQQLGVLALVAAPNPLAMDGTVNGLDPFPGECTEPARFPQDPGVAGVWFCQIVVAGVAAMASVGAP